MSLLTFNVFNIFKLLLTSLMYISAIVITHHWVTSVAAYLFRRHFVASRGIVHDLHPTIGILNWRWRPSCWLFDCWFFAIDLALLLVCRIQEGRAWILLVAIVTDHVLATGGKIQCFGFCKAHSHLVCLCHSKCIIIAVLVRLRQFWQFGRIVLEFVTLHNDESVNWITNSMFLIRIILIIINRSRFWKWIYHDLRFDKSYY